MPEFVFEGDARWKSGTECDLTVKGKHIATVSPPPEFGGKQGYCVPEEIFRILGLMHQYAVSLDCKKLQIEPQES